MLIDLDQSQYIWENNSQARLGLGKFGRVGFFLKHGYSDCVKYYLFGDQVHFFITGVCLEERVCVSAEMEGSWTGGSTGILIL